MPKEEAKDFTVGDLREIIKGLTDDTEVVLEVEMREADLVEINIIRSRHGTQLQIFGMALE